MEKTTASLSPREMGVVPTHYLSLPNGKEAVQLAKDDTIEAALQYISYVNEVENPSDGMVYGVALRLAQRHSAILEAVEVSLMLDITQKGLFSDYESIEVWMDVHNIRQSAPAISRARSLAEVIVPWCAQNQVFPGFTPREVEQWFLNVTPEARSIVGRMGHVGPVIKKIIDEKDMGQIDKVNQVRYILSLVADPEVANEDLMHFARKYNWGKAVGRTRVLADGSVEVLLTLSSESQLEYLKEKRLKSFVSWEGGKTYDKRRLLQHEGERG